MMLNSGGRRIEVAVDTSDEMRRADDEAVAWLIRLREESDAVGVRAELEAWRTASPVNAAAWAETAHAYDRAGETRPAFSAGRVRRRVVDRRAVIAVAAAACLALAMAPTMMLRWAADHVTGAAELAALSLEDGSTVQLAPDSAIAVTYSGAHRRVRLLKGEAWFDVRHDPSRPFEVDAAGVTTTVLGTAFDVKLDSGGAATTVERGKVRVEFVGVQPAVREDLMPGEGVHVARNGAVRRSSGAEAVGAWRDRRIVVEDRPASEVIAALRPWFRGVIISRDHPFVDRRVTGVYDAGDPVEALRGLLQATGGRVTRITPWIVVLTGG